MYPSVVPFLPPLTDATIRDYFTFYLSAVAAIITFGALLAPALELHLGMGGVSKAADIERVHCTPSVQTEVCAVMATAWVVRPCVSFPHAVHRSSAARLRESLLQVCWPLLDSCTWAIVCDPKCELRDRGQGTRVCNLRLDCHLTYQVVMACYICQLALASHEL